MSLAHIDIRIARHIVCVAQHLSFTRAARELSLTQSALSRSIQQVERVLDVKLFDRDRTKVELTPQGRVVVDGAAELLHQARSFDEVLQRVKTGAQTAVDFGMARTAASALLAQVLQSELQTNPELRHRVMVRSFDQLLEMLLARQIEFFVSAEHRHADRAKLQVQPIANFAMTQLVRTGHPLLRPGAKQHLDNHAWLMSSADALAPNAKQMGHPHLRPFPEIVLEDLGCAARLTEVTDLIWVTSTFSAARELREGRLQQLALPGASRNEGHAQYRLMIYRLVGCTLSPAAERINARFAALASQLQDTI